MYQLPLFQTSGHVFEEAPDRAVAGQSQEQSQGSPRPRDDGREVHEPVLLEVLDPVAVVDGVKGELAAALDAPQAQPGNLHVETGLQ